MNTLTQQLVRQHSTGQLDTWWENLLIWWNITLRDAKPSAAILRRAQKEADQMVQASVDIGHRPWHSFPTEEARIERCGDRTDAELLEEWRRALVKMYLPDTSFPDDIVKAWKRLRPIVLKELNTLGLEATIVRTDGNVPIGDHEADLAGLVKIELPGYDRTERLTLPKQLREFCGQFYAHDKALDHGQAYFDEYDEPTMTCRLYGRSDEQWAHLNRVLDELPLLRDAEVVSVVDGRITELHLELRWDPDAEPLPADLRPLQKGLPNATDPYGEERHLPPCPWLAEAQPEFDPEPITLELEVAS